MALLVTSLIPPTGYWQEVSVPYYVALSIGLIEYRYDSALGSTQKWIQSKGESKELAIVHFMSYSEKSHTVTSDTLDLLELSL